MITFMKKGLLHRFLKPKDFRYKGSVAVLLLFALCASPFAAEATAQAPFTPRISASADTYRAGENPTIEIRVEKNQDLSEQRLRNVELKLPTGLYASMAQGNYCGLAQTGANYFCSNPSSKVGQIELYITLDPDPEEPDDEFDLLLPVDIYLERPSNPDEVARLVAIPELVPSTALLSSVRLTDNSSRVVIEMNDLPTSIDLFGSTYALHAYKLDMTLDGTKGVQEGKPFIENPAYCNPENTLKATFTSYGDDGLPDPDPFGDDVTIEDEVPYVFTGCASIPYRPSLDLGISSSSAGQTTALVSSLQIPESNAPTKKMQISAPKGFLLNPDTGLASCPEGSFDARSCNATSKLGDISVTTPLLSEGLTGSIFLGPAEGERLKVLASIEGTYSFALAGYLTQRSDQGIDLVFPDMPPLPITSMQLSLAKGTQGILLNPYLCGTYTATSAFASYNDLSSSFSNPLVVSGCTGKVPAQARGSLDVSLRPRRSASYVDLRLTLDQQKPAPISLIEIKLPTNLWVYLRKKASKKSRLAYIEFWNREKKVARGTLKLSKKKQRRYYRLKTGNAQLKGLSLLFKRSGKDHYIVLKGLPKSEITDFKLYIWGKHSRLLYTKGRCKQRLRFSARINGSTTIENRLALRCRKQKSGKKSES